MRLSKPKQDIGQHGELRPQESEPLKSGRQRNERVSDRHCALNLAGSLRSTEPVNCSIIGTNGMAPAHNSLQKPILGGNED
jgi:hypothetical protein